ncbi:GGDEF domain-containing protein [Rhodococcoides kyotonense]|uniref:Diguanylate cyclase (GGDEF) domain-containing protein n=1 Tax=Rhodococcoides kyotonense TaxID=398843 RepID=A0A239CRG0_9NOCA|nr:GGDEF domain-containing protein [Rhodococcus kyotonensis]SNS22677.1 diguanylate cyclase (GGDEF) domain-containing protein [Rhodococcus kyotonensis]
MFAPLGRRIVASLSAVVLVVVVVTSGLLSYPASVALDDAAQLVAGLAATVTCTYTGRRRRGSQRRWRLLMAAGMACWTAGMVVWATYRSILDTPLPSPSFADFGFFLFPVFAVPALLAVLGRTPRRTAIDSNHAWATSLLDGTVIVGSLFVLSWSTVLGQVARQDESDSLQFLVALMYPVTDLVLVVLVALLAVVPRILRRYRSQLALLGCGLVSLAVSDSVYAYLVAVGADSMPLLADAGFIAGPVLIALAATTPAVGASFVDQGTVVGSHSWPDRLASDRTQLLVPYALLATIGVVVAVQWIAGGGVDPVVLALFFVVVVLAIVRQVVTLLQNDTLLRKLSDAQTELLHRAHHDGLTGLLNRSAFDDHLARALERRTTHGQVGVLLLVDLDDFKGINDRLGHAAGDRSLQTLSRRLVDTVEVSHERGIVARFGGDEFTVLIPAGIDDGCAVAKAIVDAIRAPQAIEGRSVSIGASVGVVELDVFEHDVTADTLLRSADRAMYEAKKNGKAGVFAYDSDGTLRMVYNLSNTGAPFDWWGTRRTGQPGQGSRGINPNIVAGEPDPARLIGPPTRM